MRSRAIADAVAEDTYELFAIRYGTNPRRRRVENLIYTGPDDPHDAPMPMDFFVWAAVGRTRTVLIDTGADASTCRARGHDFLRCPSEGLVAIGVTADTVGAIVTTHMHWDHAGNIELFPDARLHVQRLELAHASGPSMTRPFLRRPYDPEQLAAYLKALYQGRVTFHDGADEIAPGISIHRVGGHTPGMQVARIRTRRGHVLLASDAVHYHENLAQQNPFPVLVSTIDYVEALATVSELADSPEHVIPGHDPEVLATYPSVAQDIVRLDEPPASPGPID
jgi:glyoxylase-like metal-dependent hydrolase (beta-lactamase superfamily II)